MSVFQIPSKNLTHQMYDQRDKNFNKQRGSLDQFNDFYDDYATYRRKDVTSASTRMSMRRML